MSDFGALLQDLSDRPLSQKACTSHSEKIGAILRYMSENGKTFEYCTGPLILARSRRTLEKYCREHSVAFPDYKPRSMSSSPTPQE